MDQAVQPAEFLADDARERVVFHRGGGRQIQRRDRRLRRTQRFDFIVDALELGAVASRQDDAGAGAGALDGRALGRARCRRR